MPHTNVRGLVAYPTDATQSIVRQHGRLSAPVTDVRHAHHAGLAAARFVLVHALRLEASKVLNTSITISALCRFALKVS